MKKTLYLVRHGQTDATKQHLWIGARTQFKLNEDGRDESEIAAVNLRNRNLDCNHIYTSPVERCYQTARIIQNRLLVPLTPVPNLSEMFFGDLEGVDEEIFKTDFPVQYKLWTESCTKFTPPNGESGREFLDRVVAVVTRLATEVETKDVVIVTHSGVVKLFLAYIMEKDLEVGWRNLDVPRATTGSITRISFDDETEKFEFIENIGSGING